MILDRLPDVSDSDEGIINFVIEQGMNKLPIIYVPLAGAVLQSQPNVAMITWTENKVVLERIHNTIRPRSAINNMSNVSNSGLGVG